MTVRDLMLTMQTAPKIIRMFNPLAAPPEDEGEMGEAGGLSPERAEKLRKRLEQLEAMDS